MYCPTQHCNPFVLITSKLPYVTSLSMDATMPTIPIICNTVLFYKMPYSAVINSLLTYNYMIYHAKWSLILTFTNNSKAYHTRVVTNWIAMNQY